LPFGVVQVQAKITHIESITTQLSALIIWSIMTKQEWKRPLVFVFERIFAQLKETVD